MLHNNVTKQGETDEFADENKGMEEITKKFEVGKSRQKRQVTLPTVSVSSTTKATIAITTPAKGDKGQKGRC